MYLTFDVKMGDFSNAGKVSSEIKGILKQLNINPKDIKRIIVALYEAEVNVVAHSYGGKIECLIDSDRVIFSPIGVIFYKQSPHIFSNVRFTNTKIIIFITTNAL
jgi:hypothetical protein